MATPSEGTGPVEKANGKAYGRVFSVRKALLSTVEATLSRLVDEDGQDAIPAWAYDGTGQERVKIQLTVFRGDV